MNVAAKSDSIVQSLATLYSLQNHDFDGILKSARRQIISKQASQAELFHSIIVLGEFVRREKAGHWIIMKTYGTFNPYYILGIIYQDGRVVNLSDRSELFFESNDMSLTDFLRIPPVKKPVLIAGSPLFNTRYPDYKIFDNMK